MYNYFTPEHCKDKDAPLFAKAIADLKIEIDNIRKTITGLGSKLAQLENAPRIVERDFVDWMKTSDNGRDFVSVYVIDNTIYKTSTGESFTRYDLEKLARLNLSRLRTYGAGLDGLPKYNYAVAFIASDDYTSASITYVNRTSAGLNRRPLSVAQ